MASEETPPEHLIVRYPAQERPLKPASQNAIESMLAPSSRSGMYEGRHGSRVRLPVHRPPGAVDETTFLSECTRCDACIVACPHDAILRASDRFGEASGTPIIDADRSPCRMCADVPCVSACEAEVLRLEASRTMGLALIVEETCIAHRGMTCSVCVEQCPVEGAIEVRDGKPRVVDDACTGCGVCRYVCPAPENAVVLTPIPDRPAPGDDAAAQRRCPEQDDRAVKDSTHD